MKNTELQILLARIRKLRDKHTQKYILNKLETLLDNAEQDEATEEAWREWFNSEIPLKMQVRGNS